MTTLAAFPPPRRGVLRSLFIDIAGGRSALTPPDVIVDELITTLQARAAFASCDLFDYYIFLIDGIRQNREEARALAAECLADDSPRCWRNRPTVQVRRGSRW